MVEVVVVVVVVEVVVVEVVVVEVVVVEVVVGWVLVVAGSRLEAKSDPIAGATATSMIDVSGSEQLANTEPTSTTQKRVLTQPAHHMVWT